MSIYSRELLMQDHTGHGQGDSSLQGSGVRSHLWHLWERGGVRGGGCTPEITITSYRSKAQGDTDP